MQLSSSRGSVSVAESWRSFYDETGVPSAVESGALVWVTGHTGTRADGSVEPDDTEQVRPTFRNVSDSLDSVGLSLGRRRRADDLHRGAEVARGRDARGCR